MTPLALTEWQLNVIRVEATALFPWRRPAFMAAVADELCGKVIDDATVIATARAVVQRFIGEAEADDCWG